MRARSLVVFTMLGQTAVGLFWAQAVVGWAVPGGGARMGEARLLVGVLMAAGGLAALLHLGTPRNAWRAMGNLRGSWLSREVAASALFMAGWVVAVPARAALPPTLGGAATALTALLGAGLVYAMARVYRLRTVPAWDTGLTTASFFLTAASSGVLLAAAAVALAAPGGAPSGLLRALLTVGVLTLAVELGAEAGWRTRRRAARDRVDAGLNPRAEVDRAARWRIGLLGAGIVASVLGWLGAGGAASVPVTRAGVALAFLIGLAAGVVGRDRFYATYARRGL